MAVGIGFSDRMALETATCRKPVCDPGILISDYSHPKFSHIHFYGIDRCGIVECMGSMRMCFLHDFDEDTLVSDGCGEARPSFFRSVAATDVFLVVAEDSKTTFQPVSAVFIFGGFGIIAEFLSSCLVVFRDALACGKF